MILFYIFSALTLCAGLGVLLHPNPVLGALHLVAVMIGISGLFFTLQAPFIAAVQIMVYAGAVMVLFLFVVMVFNLKEEKTLFSHGKTPQILKVIVLGVFAGIFFSSILFKISRFGYFLADPQAPQFEVRNLSRVLYTDFIFHFEVLGLLLLVVPIGVVALSRVGRRDSN